MGRRSKGERGEYKARVPARVDVEALAAARGCSSVSVYISDLICLDAGRHELAEELRQGVLPISA